MVLPMYCYPIAHGFGLAVLVFVAGAFVCGSHSAIVVLVQALFPHRRALASGLSLGFMFASGSLASYLYGLVADVYPLGVVMQTNGVLCLLAAILCLILLGNYGSARILR